MLGIKNTILAVLITAVLGWAYAQYEFKQGISLGKQQQIAEQALIDSKVDELNQKNLEFLAERVSEIKVENKTIYQKATKEVITNEKVYNNPDCNVPASGVSNLNEALSPRK